MPSPGCYNLWVNKLLCCINFEKLIEVNKLDIILDCKIHKRLIHDITVILRSCAVQAWKKVCSFTAQYPVVRIAQSALHFISLTDLFNQTPSQLLWEASSYAAINARRLLVHIPTSVYSHVIIYTAELIGAM